MKRFKFLLIGCGKAADIHIVYIKKYGTLVGVCDDDEEKGMAFAKKHGSLYYYGIVEFSMKELAVDIVVICSPNGAHYYDAFFSLNCEFHVLIEKPFTLTANAATNLIKIAKDANVEIFTIMQNRFNPPVAALKKALKEKRLGKIYSVQVNCFWNRNDDYYTDSWHGTKDMDGGILFTQFSHFIDLLIWFFGMPKTVNRMSNNIAHQKKLAFEDQGVVNMQWKNGMLGSMHYTINAYEQNREGSITVMGEKGIVKIGGEYLNTIEYADVKDYQLIINEPSAPANDYGTYQGSMRNHGVVYKSMIDHLTKGTPYYTTPQEARATIALIRKIISSK